MAQTGRSDVLGRTAAGLFQVWAGKQRGYDFEELRQSMERGEAQGEAADRAALRGHVIGRWLRARDGEAATRCEVCARRLYVNASEQPPIMAGDVFERDCA